MYILLGALLLVCFNRDFCNIPVAKLWIVLPASLLGIWLSMTALTIIRKEGEYFHTVLRRRAALAVKLGVDTYFDKPPPVTNRPICSLLSTPCRTAVSYLRICKAFCRLKRMTNSLGKAKSMSQRIHVFMRLCDSRASIRDWFQLTFVASIGVFLALVGFSVYAHLAKLIGW